MGKACSCPHHKIMPIGLILIGLTFLAGQMNWVSAMFVAVTWPILLILIGIGKWMGEGCMCDMKK